MFRARSDVFRAQNNVRATWSTMFWVQHNAHATRSTVFWVRKTVFRSALAGCCAPPTCVADRSALIWPCYFGSAAAATLFRTSASFRVVPRWLSSRNEVLTMKGTLTPPTSR
jgi:hypothetical protein